MRLSVQICSLLISLLATILLPNSLKAQGTFPSSDGEKSKYVCQIEMPKGYISGICVLRQQDGKIRGSIFNEFGISAMDFSYDLAKEKIKLYSVIKVLDRWYIRRMLRKDLGQVMMELKKGGSIYENKRYHIVYTFDSVNDSRQDDGEW